jgi:hypothetical protein
MCPLLLSIVLLTPTQPPKAAPTPLKGEPPAGSPVAPFDAGVLPVGANGKALNLDFETGDLKDWTAEGEAFKDQPIQGDTVAPRRPGMQSRHQGQYWIGGYEKQGDEPTGTLTSVPFKVTHPWGSFLVGGGSHAAETCVEIVSGKDVIFRATGTDTEDMTRVAVDLTKYKDKDIFIRIVDKHSGGWGHINFDDFRFHEKKPAPASADLLPVQPPKVDPNDTGVLPVGANGKALNLDFEDGTLKDWTAEGEAFRDQPIQGDTVAPRRFGSRSRHQGQYWIGGYEKLFDPPTGTLTSVPFKVTHPWASFLVGGGPHEELGVEIVVKETGAVFYRARSSVGIEDMTRVWVDMKAVEGKEVFIRIVDNHTGDWGHINFDDFRFHQKGPK